MALGGTDGVDLGLSIPSSENPMNTAAVPRPASTSGAHASEFVSLKSTDSQPVSQPVSQLPVKAGVCVCGFANEVGSKFCEDCGKPLDQAGVLIATRACSACSSTTFDADGYCQDCGTKAPSPRDHATLDFGIVASVTDRGISHPINQDAVDCALFIGSETVELIAASGVADPSLGNNRGSRTALAYDRLTTRAILVVCDGVSTSSSSDVASAAAVSVTKVRLQQCIISEPELAVSALIEAAKLAQTAVSSTPFRKTIGLDAPSCTFVAATIARGRITVGNIGDSRAYVFGDGGHDLHLSADDSWAAEETRSGRRTPENAESDPRAHMITRWLGSDAPNVVPSIIEHEPDGPAIVLLCSDGLWNYASSVAHLRRILDDTIEDLLDAASSSAGTVPSAERQTRSAAEAYEISMLSIAEALNRFALDCGGQDNIAIALLRMGPPITSWTRNSERVPRAGQALLAVATNESVQPVETQHQSEPTDQAQWPEPAEEAGVVQPSHRAQPSREVEPTRSAKPGEQVAQHRVINGAVQAETQQGASQ